jgi:hypothetical protein
MSAFGMAIMGNVGALIESATVQATFSEVREHKLSDQLLPHAQYSM